MESFRVEYDRTVRSSDGTLVDFTYGGDGWEVPTVEDVPIGWVLTAPRKTHAARLRYEDAELAGAVGHAALAPGAAEVYVEREVAALWRTARELNRHLLPDVHLRGVDRRDCSPRLPFRFEAELLRMGVRSGGPVSRRQTTSLSPRVVLDAWDELERELRDGLLVGNHRDAALPYLAAVRAYFSVRNLVILGRLSPTGFEDLCRRLRQCVVRARVAPGEMVGVLAAEAIGEPATQMVRAPLSSSTRRSCLSTYPPHTIFIRV
jgi:DNA-directed RNA polymerase II subunit RPB1